MGVCPVDDILCILESHISNVKMSSDDILLR